MIEHIARSCQKVDAYPQPFVINRREKACPQTSSARISGGDPRRRVGLNLGDDSRLEKDDRRRNDD